MNEKYVQVLLEWKHKNRCKPKITVLKRFIQLVQSIM